MKEYYEYISSDEWKNKSRAFIQEALHCDNCGSKENLQCHHKNYDCLGNETKYDIIVLCQKCHFLIHDKGIDYDLRKDILIYEKDARWRQIKKELMVLWKNKTL